MGLKYKVGALINNTVNTTVRYNYKLVPFIPNGRILPLDLKRANFLPQIIFDVGANIGQTANYYTEHFPEAIIYSFEPVKETFKTLTQNVKSKRVNTFNEGLGSALQELTIHKNDSNATSSLKENDGRFIETEIVKINTGVNFCAQNQIQNIDLLKMDVEGFELDVLNGFEGLLKTGVKMIFTEIGFHKNDPYKTYISDMLEITSNNGFIVSGFYEPYRWGKGKFNFFCNMLLVNTNLVSV